MLKPRPYIVFTKLVREFGIPELIQMVREVGADGMDLCVRDGYPVNPGNVREALPRAMKQIAGAGQVVPLVTAPTSLTRSADVVAEPMFAACHDAGVGHLKLGYWAFSREKPYWDQVDAARKELDGFAKLAMRFGVRACIHTHSGSNLGLNSSAAMHLAQGYNPAQVALYLDPGHLSLCGEPLDMAFSIARGHLALVAVKDARWDAQNGARKAHFVPIGEGHVDWAAMYVAMNRIGFGGALSLHSEYEGLSREKWTAQTKADLAGLRAIEAQAAAAG